MIPSESQSKAFHADSRIQKLHGTLRTGWLGLHAGLLHNLERAFAWSWFHFSDCMWIPVWKCVSSCFSKAYVRWELFGSYQSPRGISLIFWGRLGCVVHYPYRHNCAWGVTDQVPLKLGKQETAPCISSPHFWFSSLFFKYLLFFLLHLASPEK